MCPAFKDRCMARFGIVGAIRADAVHQFIERYLPQQRGRIAHAVVGHFDGLNVQRVRVDTQVTLSH